MEGFVKDREYALGVLREYVKGESLVRHALTEEAVMAHFARELGEADILKWQIIGLLHDIDYELYPEQHCHKVRDLLGPHGFPEEYMRAIESHGYLLVNDVEPLETMEKVLYATDELTGLIAATALMRPGASILDLEVKSVKKKFKQKGFAAGVDREVILRGAQMLGMELDALIARTIEGMRPVAWEIGLAGEG
jgi:putative nucleotidyltransferase with HDIG domain